MSRLPTPLPDFRAIWRSPNRGNPTSPPRGEVLVRALASTVPLRGEEVLPLALAFTVFVPSPLGGEGQGEG